MSGSSAAVGGAICLGAWLAFPDIQFGPVWAAILAVPAIYALLGVTIALQCVFPQSAAIGPRYVWRDGQRNAVTDVEKCRLLYCSPIHRLLILDVRVGRRLTRARIALPADLDESRLHDLLFDLRVVDRAKLFARLLR